MIQPLPAVGINGAIPIVITGPLNLPHVDEVVILEKALIEPAALVRLIVDVVGVNVA